MTQTTQRWVLNVPHQIPSLEASLKLREPHELFNCCGRRRNGDFSFGVSPPRFVFPQLPLDLSANASASDDGDDDRDDDLLLTPLLEGMARFRLDPQKFGVVSWRHNLIKILTAPYASAAGPFQREWAVDVERVAGTLFLGIVKCGGEEAPNEWQRKCERWGRAFERLCTTPEPPRPFCRAIETGIGTHRMLIGAEIDAEGLELKTHNLSSGIHADKLLRIWGQSYLGGIPEVVIGHRSDSGIIQRISRIPVARIPTIDSRGRWSASLCLWFLNRTIDWLFDSTAAVQQRRDPGDGFRLSFSPPFRELVLEPRSCTKVVSRRFQLQEKDSPR